MLQNNLSNIISLDMARVESILISAKCAFQSIPTELSIFMVLITSMTIRAAKSLRDRLIYSRSQTRPIRQ